MKSHESRMTYIIFPLFLVLYEVALYLTNDAYLPALPSILSDLNAPKDLTQLTITLWFVGASSTQLFIGPISDRFGRRPVLFIGGIFFLIACLIAATTNDINTLLLTRVLQGAGVTTMIVPGYAAIHELFDEKRAIKTLSWMHSITVIAPSVGPLFGSIVIYFSDWRWIFGLIAIIALIMQSGLFITMPETCDKTKAHPIDLKRIVGNYKSIATNSSYVINTACFCLIFAAMIAWIAAGPFLIITTFDLGIFWFGFLQLFIFAAFVIGARVLNKFIDSTETNHMIKVGLSISASGGLIALISGLLFPEFLWGTIIGVTVISFGNGICFPTLNRSAMDSSNAPMGSKTAIFSASMSGMGAVSSALISTIYTGSLFSLGTLLCGFTLLALVLKSLKATTHSTATQPN